MARGKRELKLTPVDDTMRTPVPAIRLEGEKNLKRGKTLHPGGAHEQALASVRLDVPVHEEIELRTHQPGIDSLIKASHFTPRLLEADWGKQPTHHRSIPWGWFVLLGLLLTGASIWSLNRFHKTDILADPTLVGSQAKLADDARKNRETRQLIDRIEAATRNYFLTTDTDTLAKASRQPERVTPLIARHYQGKSIPPTPVRRTVLLQPLSLDHRADFWMHYVELENYESRNLIIEILDSGEPKIDWETLVCHQPMKWDDFVHQRPTGVSLDFRVYLEQDDFFSHEFTDPSHWNCFRLTALDSEEVLFGYAKTTDPVSAELLALLKQSSGQKIAVIVRVNLPRGIQSRRGVVIEKLMCPRWIYLNPPEA